MDACRQRCITADNCPQWSPTPEAYTIRCEQCFFLISGALTVSSQRLLSFPSQPSKWLPRDSEAFLNCDLVHPFFGLGIDNLRLIHHDHSFWKDDRPRPNEQCISRNENVRTLNFSCATLTKGNQVRLPTLTNPLTNVSRPTSFPKGYITLWSDNKFNVQVERFLSQGTSFLIFSTSFKYPRWFPPCLPCSHGYPCT